jgi:putative peptidoglycan lipid II flippase
MPVVLNAVLILTTLFVCPFWGGSREQQIFGLALGVLLAGFLQVGLEGLACRREGMGWGLRPAFRDPAVRRVAVLMAPAVLGVAVVQLNTLVDKVLAGWLGSAAVGALYYSQRLVYLPVGLFGVAMGVVSLTTQSQAAAREDYDAMSAQLGYALRHVLFMTLPVAALMAVLSIPVIRLLFERGSFDWQSTRETAWALWFYVPGIPAFACAKVAVTPFYARKDTRTPVRIALVCLALNVVLNLSLMWVLRQGGLALATTICSFLNVALLLRFGGRQICGTALRRTVLPALKALAATAALVVVARGAVMLSGRFPFWGDGLAGKLADVAVPAGLGAGAFVAVAAALRCQELRELLDAGLRKLRRDGRAAE